MTQKLYSDICSFIAISYTIIFILYVVVTCFVEMILTPRINFTLYINISSAVFIRALEHTTSNGVKSGIYFNKDGRINLPSDIYVGRKDDYTYVETPDKCVMYRIVVRRFGKYYVEKKDTTGPKSLKTHIKMQDVYNEVHDIVEISYGGVS